MLTGGRVSPGSQEQPLPVLGRRWMSFVAPPKQLNLGQATRITWKINFTGDASLIQSSQLLWSTGPIGGAPASSVQVVGGLFDPTSGTWSATIPAQSTEGILY